MEDSKNSTIFGMGALPPPPQDAPQKATDKFDELLFMVGYIESEEYLEFNYILIGDQSYRVRDGFPKICNEDLNPGVFRVSYSIELEKCLDFEGKPNWMEEIE